jgi:uncharacterized Ntn-hydrolase superfamily protein
VTPLRSQDLLPNRYVATFSIIGHDPVTGELGIAVQSKFLAVGAVVPWAKAGVGAIATQSYANTSYGPRGLALLELGLHPQEVIEVLTRDDPDRDYRQFAVMDRHGNTAAYTGPKCYDWAGHVTGPGFSCQGNILVGEDTVKAMATTFQNSTGPLGERLILALDAGQRAGGDARGRQSAALLVVKEGGGYGGFNDRAVDLRVDDHPDPIAELRRLYEMHRLYFETPSPDGGLALTGDVLSKTAEALRRLGWYEGPQPERETPELWEALRNFTHTENLEQRWREDGRVDEQVHEYLLRKAGL